jgi:hypothetical protein
MLPFDCCPAARHFKVTVCAFPGQVKTEPQSAMIRDYFPDDRIRDLVTSAAV